MCKSLWDRAVSGWGDDKSPYRVIIANEGDEVRIKNIYNDDNTISISVLQKTMIKVGVYENMSTKSVDFIVDEESLRTFCLINGV